ncbi:Peptide hydrolase {ECO:0000256/RuleBase:RU361240} {ECO:0000256/RuleBase:RU361240} [Serendipita indica DSM 11827]|nr:Peptide hydrolase {ECO:0000256/RuleBase:RU361240} {ECO:0000256/RuleBase:RU361240} [Serendipita indica DSM 11827]
MWTQLFPSSFLALLLASVTAGYHVEPRSLNLFSDTNLVSLATTPDPRKNIDPYDPHSHLYNILIPRPPDTANNTLVRNYIAKTLRDLQWHVEEDSFEDETPYGRKKFTNIIATKDPDAPRRIILAAHFDSKFFPTAPDNQFLGATDSAAPCAMLLDLAGALNPMLNERMERLEHGLADDEEEEAGETTLQLVFFDGEEAFKIWTATDSIYGARHLAEKWSTEFVSPIQARKLFRAETQISTIEHFVLLDLLGSPRPLISSHFPSTAWLFDGLVHIEHRLGRIGMFNEDPNANPGQSDPDGEAGEWHAWSSFFVPRSSYAHNWGGIEDDHIPFMQRGVNILHIIATPFPQVWHTIKDDASALDIPTMRRWNILFRVFTAEYLRLKPSNYNHKRDEL